MRILVYYDRLRPQFLSDSEFENHYAVCSMQYLVIYETGCLIIYNIERDCIERRKVDLISYL